MLHFFYILSGSNFVHPPSPKNFGNFLEYYTTRVVLGYYTTRVVLKVSILALFLWLVDCICCTTAIYFRFSFYCPWMKHFFFQIYSKCNQMKHLVFKWKETSKVIFYLNIFAIVLMIFSISNASILHGILTNISWQKMFSNKR
jgi:hypothetical protein